jgi:CMP-N,N'-diacetyllegionaminic acid synthase
MKTLVVIPARGGSKGVPNKNIKLLNGKPLISYTIDAAKKVFEKEHVLISTDSVKIKNEVENCGVIIPFLRPAFLATDKATTYDVLLNALEYYESKNEIIERLVLLQPTSPFRTEKHIKEALKLYDNSIDMVVSVNESKSNPYYNLFEENKSGYLIKSKKNKTFTRRQDCPKVWEYNGAIYVINVASLKQKQLFAFKKIRKYEMDDISSHDIDTQLDWIIAEQIVKFHF